MARVSNQSEIARAAGVSVSTVSRALSNAPGISTEVRQQIQGLAKEFGYQGRSGLALATRLVRTYVTANLVTGGLVAFYGNLVQAMQSAAASAGLQLEIKLVQKALEPHRIVRDSEHEPAAATLLVGLDLDPDIAAHYTADRPMVLVNTFDPLMRFDSIAPANFYGAAYATQHLLAAGHRDLLHLREQIRWTTLQREHGFRAALREVPGAVGEVADILEGDAALAALARRRADGTARWTGVFAVHDNAAIRFIHALEDAGLRVPRDVSVIGFDDLPAAAMMSPRLSTMRVDTHAMGREAIALLLRRISDPGACPIQVECGVTPVIGETLRKIS